MADLIRFYGFNELEKNPVFSDGEIIFAADFSEKQLLELREIAKKTELKISFCKILGRPEHKQLHQFRNKVEYLAVEGRDMQLNKFACSTKGIDFLLQPFDSGKLYFDVSMARLAAANNVAIAFIFSDFLNSNGARLSLLLKNAATVKKLVKRARAKSIIFSGANNRWEMRSKENLAEFLEALE